MSTSSGKLILKQWIASLQKRSRKVTAISSNFADFVSDMNISGIEYEEAESLMADAIRAHYPDVRSIKNTWSAQKQFYPGMTEKEFVDQWKQMIDNKGWAEFWEVYTNPAVAKPKMIGGMSPEEFTKQQKIAAAFEEANVPEAEAKFTNMVEELRKRLLEMGFDPGDYNE